MAERRKKRKFNRIVSRRFALFTWLIVLAVVTMIYWRYIIISESSNEQLMFTASYLAMDMVDGDIHSKIGLTEDEYSASYNLIQQELQKIQDSSERFDAVYTWRYNSDNQLVFVVDVEPEEGSYLGDIYPYDIEILEENRYTIEGPIIESEFTTDQWGVVKTVYSPILTSDGQIDGYIGIDVTQDIFLADRNSFVEILGMILFGTIFMSALLSRYITKNLMKPFEYFVVNVEKSAQSHFKILVPEEGNSLIEDLAVNFNKAATKARRNNEDIELKVSERTSELEKLTQNMVDREIKMRELKKEISQLKESKNV